ncbi:MAG: hypothetical protein ABIG11_10605 [bacterium]
MKRFGSLLPAVITALAFMTAVSALRPAHAAAADSSSGVPARVELFWEALDGRAWQSYFLLDAVRRRFGRLLDVRITCLVGKNADGSWKSSRGGEETAESMRMATVQELHRGRLWDYLAGRSLNPAEGGWREAARFAGMVPEKLEAEVSKKGDALLKKHFERAARAGITGFSVQINGRLYSVENRLVPFAEAVNAALPPEKRVLIPEAPKQQPGAAPQLWVVASSASAAAGEDKNLTAAVEKVFPGMKAKLVEYGSTEAARFAAAGLEFLPAYILEDTPGVRSALKHAVERGALVPRGGYLVLKERAREGFFTANPRKPGLLEIFVMSQCPYGIQAENSIIEAYRKKLLPEGTQVKMRYIVDLEISTSGAKRFRSLHGPAEWEENARQLFMQEKYPEKFFDYLLARNIEPGSSLWQNAVKKAGIRPAEVEAGFERGRELLADDAALSSLLGINSSPTFLWEGQTMTGGLAGVRKIAGFGNVPLQASPQSGSCKN